MEPLAGVAGLADEAMAHYQKALQIQPNYPNALSNPGIAFFQEGKEAEAHFRQALEIEPDTSTRQLMR
jgi:tetratricopeptide (TPR) repeat protein